MRKSVLVFSILLIAGLFACKKNDPNSPNFINLTNHIWQSDSLLANGEEAGGPGQMLEKFNGDAIFNKDGTGVFGQYEGEWYFAFQETRIVISSDSLPIPNLTTDIEELTNSSLKITTAFPNFSDPENPTNIRMTFLPK